MPKCPVCGEEDAYIGFTSVECKNPNCKNYKTDVNNIAPKDCNDCGNSNPFANLFGGGSCLSGVCYTNSQTWTVPLIVNTWNPKFINNANIDTSKLSIEAFYETYNEIFGADYRWPFPY